MGMIYTRSPHTRQPQGPVQPSAWARSRGIGSLLLPSAGLRDLVDGGTWSSWGTAPVIGTGLHGRCIDSTAAFGGLMLLPKTNLATAAQTFVLVIESVATSGAYAGVLAVGSANGSSPSLAVQRDSGDTQWAIWASGFTGGVSGGTAFGPSVVVVSGNATGIVAYKDGSQWGTATGGPVALSNSRIVLFGERSASATYSTKGRVYLAAHFPRRLLSAEIAAVSANPWGTLFAPIAKFTFSTINVQMLRPATDISAGSWTASTGSSLYAMLDETTFDDTDYILSSVASTTEIKLSSGSTPGTGPITICYRAKNNGSGSLVAKLYQGATLISTHYPELTSAYVTYTWELSAGEKASLTDYTDLRIKFTSS